MTNASLTEDQAAELQWLYSDLAAANQRVADALVTHGKTLDGAALALALNEDRKASVIIQRLKEFRATLGRDWNA